MSVSPGTVSGKVSFCMVCIAFKALRALNHLHKKIPSHYYIRTAVSGNVRVREGKCDQALSKFWHCQDWLNQNHPFMLAIAFVGDVDESVALRPLSLWQKVQFCQLSSQSPNI